MQPHDVPSRESDAAEDERVVLHQQIRQLHERLAFYEGFDLLIQDNVAQARELLRLAAQEREDAKTNENRSRQERDEREALLRAELETVAVELEDLVSTIHALSQRVARVLDNRDTQQVTLDASQGSNLISIVIHGVPSARTALSLLRFVAALPDVRDASAREYAGGVLRLEAWVNGVLVADQFRDWDAAGAMQLLTERADVIEFALDEATPRVAVTI